jgi:hypothetical protein
MTDSTHELLSKEELAYLIKVVWEALQSPSWSRDDLIEFGKAIFGKTPLKDLEPKKFNQLFPFLKSIAEHLGIKLKEAILPAPPQAAGAQEAPTPTPPQATGTQETSTPTPTPPDDPSAVAK